MKDGTRSSVSAHVSPETRALENCLKGRLLSPGHEDYDGARAIHNAAFDRTPQLVVQAESTADVLTAVNFARERGLELAVKSGGHSVPGHGTTDGLLIDLSHMNTIAVDAERQRVVVGSGATWGQVAEATQPFGLAVPAGDTASVGVGGLATGGGIGWVVRKYGLTVDSLLSAEVVTADGRVVTADAGTNQDLFWAIRGGGGNFGVVTSFEFRAHPVGMVVGGAVFYDATDGERILGEYARYAAAAPRELSTMAFIMNAPPVPFIPPHMHGKLVIAIGMVYAGDLAEGEQVVAPLRALDTPLSDLVAPMPYPAIYMLTKEAEVGGHYSDVRSMFMNDLTGESISAIMDSVRNMSSPMGLGQLRVLGGAMGDVPAGATAFAHRQAAFMYTHINVWLDANESPRHQAWTNEMWRGLQPYADGTYVNFLSDEGEDRVLQAYGAETYLRLAQIKRRYDPNNIFHRNQNIKPAAAEYAEKERAA